MPYLYRQYCYPTLDDAAREYWSDDRPTDRMILTSYAGGGSDAVVFTRQQDGTSLLTTRSETVTFLQCPMIGPTHTDTAMTVADSLELGWAIAATWLFAWCIKTMRRGL